jgi:beta-lactamase superfamily II metal-dependent hydrolase
MNFSLEALQAADGDCLLLHYDADNVRPVHVLIDGGSKGIYNSVLMPRLGQLATAGQLNLRAVIVSHIDADHITGIVDFFKDMKETEDSGGESSYRVQSLWHNSFENLHHGKTATVASAGVVSTATSGALVPGLNDDVAAVVASIPQGNQVRNYATQLGVPLNKEFDGKLVCAPEEQMPVIRIADGLTFSILGPSTKEVDDLEEAWNKAKTMSADPSAQAADYLNRTVPNLSSIVILAEVADPTRPTPCRMLLTGDAGCDLIWDAIQRYGLAKDNHFQVDLLKASHHGSRHSVDQDFLEKVTADSYVFSGNGKHDNPHRDVLEWLSAARKNQPYDAYFTNRLMVEDRLTAALEDFLTQEKTSQPMHRYHFRTDPQLSIEVRVV